MVVWFSFAAWCCRCRHRCSSCLLFVNVVVAVVVVTIVVQVQSVLDGTAGTSLSVQWTHVVCSSSQYAVLSNHDTVTCMPCPVGGQCSSAVASTAADVAANATLADVQASVLSDVVVQQGIVALQGYWASPVSDGAQFYQCPVADACLAGGNGTRARCADGYEGVLCSVCSVGYFEQFNRCVHADTRVWGRGEKMLEIGLVLRVVVCYVFTDRTGGDLQYFRLRGVVPPLWLWMLFTFCVASCDCACLCICMRRYYYYYSYFYYFYYYYRRCVKCPAARSQSVGAVVGIVAAAVVCGAVVYSVRALLPVDVLKLGVSMVQIIASASSAYDIPWPSEFSALLDGLRVFLVRATTGGSAGTSEPGREGWGEAEMGHRVLIRRRQSHACHAAQSVVPCSVCPSVVPELELLHLAWLVLLCFPTPQVDVISMTRANCAQPMTFYDSLVVMLVGFKVVVLLVLVLPWLVRALIRCRVVQDMRTSMAMKKQAKAQLARNRDPAFMLGVQTTANPLHAAGVGTTTRT